MPAGCIGAPFDSCINGDLLPIYYLFNSVISVVVAISCIFGRGILGNQMM
jgi:hypothetical protein